MPYKTIAALPKSVKGVLPKEAARQFLRVVNSQLERDMSEEKAFASAWAVIKENWHKNGDGKWVKKAELPESPDMQLVSKNERERYTLGVVYEPDSIDTQDDYATAETIKAAAYGFMRKLQSDMAQAKQARDILQGIHAALSGEEVRIDITDFAESVEKGRLGDMHVDWQDGFGEVVESYIAPVDFEIDGEVIKQGSWLVGVIWSHEMFEKIENGERTGYSLGGRAIRV